MALARINIRSGIITRLRKDDYHQLDVFRNNGVDVFAYESELTTGIKNTYVTDDLDKRICEPIAFAGGFEEDNIPHIECKVLHIGSLMAGEVSLKLVKYLTERFPKVSLDLQGFQGESAEQ